ncbi:MAG: XRE family transcriptional regulator [Terracidiphilus sp.]|nr:XRE family transcriptional regulator [Terracidiphilus sp.]
MTTKTVSYAQWSMEPYSIGLKLRALRTQKRLTLARLAAETGLSTALLSKLETDRMIPTLPTLATISRVYGVGMSYFFREPERHTLSITRKAHLEGYERGMEQVKVIPLNAVGEWPQTGGVAMGMAGPAAAGKDQPAHSAQGGSGARSTHRAQGAPPRLVAQMIEFGAAGAASALDSLQQGSGLVYVLEGRLQLDSGGLHELLEAGDCAYVESDMALVWSAAGKDRCRVLAVFPGGAGTEG